MAGLKEIKRRLASVRNTKKITYAMKLVSAAKLRRAQESVSLSREYRNVLNQLLADLIAESGSSDVAHPLLESRKPVKTLRILVVGGSRGLCGGYNANVNRKVEALIRERLSSNPSLKIEAVLVGRKPAEYFRRVRRDYVAAYEALPEDPNLWPIEEISQNLSTDFTAQKVDEVVLIYTKFKSAMSMTVMAEQLLPMSPESLVGSGNAKVATKKSSGVTLFEPSVQAVFEAVLPRILSSNIRQACLDARASEYGSRMTAMDSATKNAGELVQKLQLTHNKVRQLGITSQLLDIVGGAEAVK